MRLTLSEFPKTRLRHEYTKRAKTIEMVWCSIKTCWRFDAGPKSREAKAIEGRKAEASRQVTILWAIAWFAVAIIFLAAGMVVGLSIVFWVTGVDVIKVVWGKEPKK